MGAMQSALAGFVGRAPAALGRTFTHTARRARGDSDGSFANVAARPARVAPALLRRPGAVVFVDDDPAFLEALAMAVSSRRRQCWYFTHPRQVIEHLQLQAPFDQADFWQHQSMVRKWMEGEPLAPQLLHYWASQTERFGLTRMVVADAHMPALSGADLFDAIAPFSCVKALLTGSENDRTAVSVLNADRADYFLAKKIPHLRDTIEELIDRAADNLNSRAQCTWGLVLSPPQQNLLFIGGQPLARRIARHFDEYAIIDEPFGALGICPGGGVGWLQFVQPMRASLPQRVHNTTLMTQLLDARDSTEAPVEPLNDDLGVAFFDLSEHALRLPAVTDFDEWLSRQPKRRVESAIEE